MSSPDAAALRAALQELVRRFGLLAQGETPCGMPLSTSQAHALMILRAAGDDGLSQGALAERLGIDKSNGSRLVRQLAAKGQVAVRGAPGEDRRVKRVRLTARGARLADDVERASRRRFADVWREIAPRHRRAVLEGLTHLTRALSSRSEP